MNASSRKAEAIKMKESAREDKAQSEIAANFQHLDKKDID